MEPRVTIAARAGTLPAPSPSPERAPLLRVDSSLVLIPVSVTNAEGGPLIGLGRENFRLQEDNIEQTIASISTEEAPVSVGLLFDASGSMRTKMRKAIEAAAAFFRTANPGDDFFLIEFNDRVRVTIPFTLKAADVYKAVTRIKPGGRTSLIDAIYLAMAQMKHARNSRKALVIVSDGGDNWSRHSVREIKNALLESDAQVYAMGIFDADLAEKHPVEERNGPALLEELTTMTGGRQFPVSDIEHLPEIAGRVGRELRSQYLLGYYPTDTARDGKYRRIKVMLNIPDAHDCHAYYRRGYYSLQ